MLDQAQLHTIKSYLEQAHTITIVCGVEPSIDVLAVVSTLNQALSTVGKEVRVLSSRPVDTSVVSGLENVEENIGKQNLVVSFPYDENAVDKVSYHIGEDSGQFFLTIKPKKGQAPLDSKSVEFSYTGAESDLLLLVGVKNFNELEQLYIGYEDFFEKTPKISFTPNGTSLGNVNVTSMGYSSMSECVVVLLNSLQMDFSVDSATNLLSAIDVETDYMRSLKASAVTFEAVAQLMRLGARRVRPQKQQPTMVQKAPSSIIQETELTISTAKPQSQTQTVSLAESLKKLVPQEQNEQKTVLPTGDQQSQQLTSKKLKRKKPSQQLSQNRSDKPGGLKYDPSRNTPRS